MQILFFDHILKISFSVSYILGFKKENKSKKIGDWCDVFDTKFIKIHEHKCKIYLIRCVYCFFLTMINCSYKVFSLDRLQAAG